MSTHISARIDDQLMIDLDAMVASTGINRNDLVKKALRTYIDSGGPDLEFATKVKNHLLNELGFSNLSDLITLIDERLDVRFAKLAEEIGEPEKASLRDEVQHPTMSFSGDFEEPRFAEPVNEKQDRKISDESDIVMAAIKQIIDGLESGHDVILSEIAEMFDLEPFILSQKIGVKTVRRTVKGRRERYYVKDKLEELKKLYEIATRNSGQV